MLDNRCVRERYACEREFSCKGIVLFILASLFFFTVGAIAGAFAASFVISSIVPIAVFAIVLLLAIAIILFVSWCNCRR